MILGILQARFNSTRLPGKVLKPILGIPMLMRQMERIRRSSRINTCIVATSIEKSDDSIEQLCISNGIPCFRGSLDNVLDRFYQAALEYIPRHIVRLTGDCPVIDPELIDKTIAFHIDGEFDYTSNALEPTFPDGMDVEVFSFISLEIAFKEASLPSHKEHVTPFIYGQPNRFNLGSYKSDENLSYLRWTVDEPDDFSLVEIIYESLYPNNQNFTMFDILKLVNNRPELKSINSQYIRNEGMIKSKQTDKEYLKIKRNRMLNSYKKSEDMLERAFKTIPLGSQTFSKSKTQYPWGVSPYFITRGQGSRVWDVDGNEYIDFVNSLAAITLGYNDPDVTAAVRTQLEDGIIFSLPHPLEIHVAEKIVEMVPCAEMVRFGKNGSDATSGAVRLARAYTNRDHIAACGYHGWQDWYIGSTARNLGVPKSTQELTHKFTYNDIDSLHEIFKKHHDQLAAVIMEPMNSTEPADGFLEKVKDLSHKNGAVFIFDETITGFRYAKGGAQEYFGVVPDLATFGKGLANGYPVSAIAGKADIMRLMEEIFFSFTFGGETLSLAAALATMTKLQKEPVIETIWKQGQKIIDGVNSLIIQHGLKDLLSTGGKACWSFLLFKDTNVYSQWELKTLFLQEFFARGILTLGTHNMSYAHGDSDIQKLFDSYDSVFAILKDVITNGSLQDKLRCVPIIPLFKVR